MTALTPSPRPVPWPQALWGSLLRNAILSAGDLRYGQRLMPRLKELQRAQWWPAERIRAFRDQKLREVVSIAWREVPFYREWLDSTGAKPQDIRSSQDLVGLPVVTKTALRSGYPHKTVRRTRQHAYQVSSSGSTGTNFAVMEDAATAGFYRASFLLALEWSGWQIGEPHMQTGMTLQRSSDRKLKDLLLRCHYLSAFDLSDASLDAALDILDGKRLQCLWGYPGSLYYLARRAAQRGWNRSLRSVVTWGDNLFVHYRNLIERTFRCRIFDTYGCGEGIQIAAQCGHQQNYHIHSLDVIVELLDDHGRPVPRGEPGNVHLTRLHAGPMPLIRYQVGDVAVQGPDAACPCGRGFELLDCVQGRDTDVVFTPSGNRLIVHFFTGILEFFDEIDSFQVLQEDLSSICVRIVPAKDKTITPEVRLNIVDALQRKGATDLRIDVEAVSDIPVAQSGKRRFVISRIPPHSRP